MRHRDEEATASGIYGVIVSAAVMSASHADKAYKVIIAVVVTLTIYWGAERYARIVAERIHEGHRPSWTTRALPAHPRVGDGDRLRPAAASRWRS